MKIVPAADQRLYSRILEKRWELARLSYLANISLQIFLRSPLGNPWWRYRSGYDAIQITRMEGVFGPIEGGENFAHVFVVTLELSRSLHRDPV
jgi:hypothetical protein